MLWAYCVRFPGQVVVAVDSGSKLGMTPAEATPSNAGGTMNASQSDDLREHIDAIQRQVTELKNVAQQARGETSAQVRARMQQAKADMAAHQESARDKAAQAAGRTQSQWQAMKADAAAKVQDLHDRMDRKRDQVDAKVAQLDAEHAETSAVDAVDYAWWAVENAELAVLDAIDARAWAAEREAATSS